MNSAPDPYLALATLYIRFVRRWSPLAAAELTAIQHTYGAYLAYWAAFTVVRLHKKIERCQQVPQRSEYADFFLENMEVLPHLECAFSKVLYDLQQHA